jgi:hypothetical protein
MSHHDDRTPGGPQVGDRALQRALDAALAADKAGVPDSVGIGRGSDSGLMRQ